MKFSTIDTDNITWSTAALFDRGGVAIPANNSMGLSALVIVNDSASDRIFRINGGAPFLVRDGELFTYGMKANETSKGGPLKIEMDNATFTSITIYGE